MAPNHPVRAAKQQPVRPYTDSQTNPSLQRAWPGRGRRRNSKDALSSWWADSEKWLELLSFSLWHGCERAVLSSRALQKPQKCCLGQSAERFCSAPTSCSHSLCFFSLVEVLYGLAYMVLPAWIFIDGSKGLPFFSHQ